MSEIKFRMFDTLEKVFMHGSRIIESRLLDLNNEGRFIYQQYLRVNDKQGVEIYEGDIVKARNGATTSESFFIGYVVFDAGEIGYKPIRYEGSRPPYMFSKDDILSLKNSKLIEVIGNVFQNPELLSKEE